MTDYIEAWQCTGCGKIEAPQPCIGVCRDRKVLMVGKDDHDEALAALQRTRDERDSALHLLSRLAHTTPREGQWERSYLALQAEARRLLAAIAPPEDNVNDIAGG